MIGRLGLSPEVAIARLKNVANQRKETTEAQTSTTWSRWMPFIITGAVVAIGAVVLVARARRKRP